MTALGAAPPALAKDDIVRSFDGTPIVLSYYRAPGLDPGERAPTVLVGHGFGGDRYARGTNVYFPQRSAVLVRFHNLKLKIPVSR